MKKNMLVILFLLCIVPYIIAIYQVILIKRWHVQLQIMQNNINEQFKVYKIRENINKQWLKNKRVLNGGNQVANAAEDVMLIASLRQYAGKIIEVQHKKNDVNIHMKITMQNYLYWLLSGSFKKSLMTPVSMQIKNNIMQLQLVQVEDDS